MDQLDSHFYKPVPPTRGQALTYTHYQQPYESIFMFAFQSDRNMAERFPFGTASAIHVNLETVGPSANDLRGAGKSLLGASPRASV